MGIKNNRIIILLLLLGIASIGSQCKKRFGCAETVYNFEIGVKAFPDNDSINIGDTIWLEINTPDTLRDQHTNELINYSGVENLGSGISLNKLGANNQFIIPAADSFDYILIRGNEVRKTDLLREYLFIEQNGNYLFQLGIIPKKKGTFGLIFSNAANVYRKSDACTKANFTINFIQTDQHYYLNPNFQGGPTPIGGDYYFYVK